MNAFDNAGEMRTSATATPTDNGVNRRFVRPK